jgi:hypothetical protein
LVVGDLEPARHVEVVRFLCDACVAPMPPHVALESVHATPRAATGASRALAALGVRLTYPTYREGKSPSATGLHAPARRANRVRCSLRERLRTRRVDRADVVVPVEPQASRR